MIKNWGLTFSSQLRWRPLGLGLKISPVIDSPESPGENQGPGGVARVRATSPKYFTKVSAWRVALMRTTLAFVDPASSTWGGG